MKGISVFVLLFIPVQPDFIEGLSLPLAQQIENGWCDTIPLFKIEVFHFSSIDCDLGVELAQRRVIGGKL